MSPPNPAEPTEQVRRERTTASTPGRWWRSGRGVLEPLRDPARLHLRRRALREERPWIARGLWLVELAAVVARQMARERLVLRASAMTFHTLLSLVPLLAVSLALFEAFGGLQRYRGELLDLAAANLAAGQAAEVGGWLDRYVGNINSGAVAGIGVAFLLYATVRLLTNVERSFNEIAGVRRGRSLPQRFAVYLTLVVVGPVLVALALSLTNRLLDALGGSVDALPLSAGTWGVPVLSAAATWLAFALLYWVLPRRRASAGAVTLGAAVAAAVWLALKAVFVGFVAGTIEYSAIYGTLGALPMVLIWLSLSWTVVLFGAVVTYAVQDVSRGVVPSAGGEELSIEAREALALRLMGAMTRALQDGTPPRRPEALATEIGAPPGDVVAILELLTRAALLVRVGDGPAAEYVLAVDPAGCTLADVVAGVRAAGRSGDGGDGAGGVARAVREALDAARERRDGALAGHTLRDLVQGTGGEAQRTTTRGMSAGSRASIS